MQKKRVPPSKKAIRHRIPWFSVGLIGLLILSLALRFWGLERFNTLVFDEVYYAKFAYNYLSQTPFFDGHPPLSKYLIAIGMWLGRQMPFGQNVQNGLTGGLFAPWTYRWLNALTGSWIPLVIAAISYQLSRRRSFALIAGLFAALDGLFLVESRYALNNVYLVLFGLLGLWTLLLALDSPRAWKRSGWLLLSGISFGASLSIKWNGLWFLLGAYGLWISAQMLQWISDRLQPLDPAQPHRWPEDTDPQTSYTDAALQAEITQFQTPSSSLQRLARLPQWQVGLYLGVVPVVTYIVEWIPHLHLNGKVGFWQDFWALQVQILQYHEQVGNGPKIHPYCSNWLSWLVMWRPVAYLYKVTGKGEPLPIGTTPLSTLPEKVIYDVHAMGNPFLWWFSTFAILLVLITLLWKIKPYVSRVYFSGRIHHQSAAGTLPGAQTWFGLAFSPSEQWLMLVIAVNYLANLLPWVRVTRCTFLYHYMGASMFSLLAIAWLVDRWIHSSHAHLRQIGFAIIAIVLFSFIFWLPIYLGLPLSPEAFKLRMWLPSWV